MGKPIIVVVDDQPFICETLENILKSMYEVFTFTSGEDAIKYISNDHCPVDIILLDYDMPNMTGYQVLLAIRSYKHHINTPVIFITAEVNERMRMEMMERGASDYICKPINSSVLHQRIKEQLAAKS